MSIKRRRIRLRISYEFSNSSPFRCTKAKNQMILFGLRINRHSLDSKNAAPVRGYTNAMKGIAGIRNFISPRHYGSYTFIRLQFPVRDVNDVRNAQNVSLSRIQRPHNCDEFIVSFNHNIKINRFARVLIENLNFHVCYFSWISIVKSRSDKRKYGT